MCYQWLWFALVGSVVADKRHIQRYFRYSETGQLSSFQFRPTAWHRTQWAARCLMRADPTPTRASRRPKTSFTSLPSEGPLAVGYAGNRTRTSRSAVQPCASTCTPLPRTFSFVIQCVLVYNISLKLDLYDKTTYKYTKDKNLAWNKYTLFDSLRFNHSNCGSPPVKTYVNKQSLLEEK